MASTCGCDPKYCFPWFEQRDFEWHCRLCWKVATDEHINSGVHKQRASYPECYGYATMKQAEPVPEHYRQPWFEFRDFQWHCGLCWKVATDEHINSDMHKQRASYPECYGYATMKQAEPVPEHYRQPWFEFRDFRWHCGLCNKEATEEHINSSQHKQRVAFPESYGFGAVSAPMTVPEIYRQPWFEYQNLEWHCRLCGKVATHEHIDSDCHKQRATNPEWYGFGDAHEVTACPDKYKKPWLVDKGLGNFFCLLCSAYATDDHLASSKHTFRAENPGSYGFGDAVDTRQVQDERRSSLASASTQVSSPRPEHALSSLSYPSFTSVSIGNRSSASSSYGGSADAASRATSVRGRSSERGQSRSYTICLEETTDHQDFSDTM
eukprot:TRINITY_DN10103_c0_g1_i1.p1 TRINITY_DN10103_c0_g1~~TRINITY_DN10103_c0_g1_i1.p1  ORF type:complete len:379 (-),score=24.10 TRINITY_DN10103_c0_g1_i1:872-2008(-)